MLAALADAKRINAEKVAEKRRSIERLIRLGQSDIEIARALHVGTRVVKAIRLGCDR